jgi:hypothetical protein
MPDGESRSLLALVTEPTLLSQTTPQQEFYLADLTAHWDIGHPHR